MNSKEGSVKLPSIELDRTLSGLYQEYCPSLSNKRIGHIFCGTTCTTDLSLDFPKNKLYVYQDSAFNDAARSTKTNDEVRIHLAPKYLSLVPQRDAFIAGKAPVIFFYSGRSKVEIEHDEAEVERTLGPLDESQKPEVLFCPGPGDVAKVVAGHGIEALTTKLVVDDIAGGAKMLCDPAALWFLNSKEALATSGLPTPPAEIIEVRGHCPDAGRCCEVCPISPEDIVPESCTGLRRRWIGEQTIRILSAVERKTLPFVFKNQQTFGGAGTYVITTGPERNQLIENMTSGGILHRMLCSITRENQHLQPGTVLLMDMVQDPVADYGITLFVGEDGAAVFLAASEQMIDRERTAWIGSSISYTHQTELEQKFSSVVSKTASWLHRHGYSGPAGIDILETKEGSYEIVDLNVRTSGSLNLPLMRKHFTSRGMHCASSLSITVADSREEFCEHWRTEIESGQLCILAWYEDGGAGKSFGDVVVGAKDDESLVDMLAKVRKASDQVTF